MAIDQIAVQDAAMALSFPDDLRSAYYQLLAM